MAEGRCSPPNSQAPTSMEMGVEPVTTAATPEETYSCPLPRKPLAIRTMNTASQQACRQSAREGRCQRPVQTMAAQSNSPARSMREPQARKGPRKYKPERG